MTLKEALIHALNGAEIRQAVWPPNNRIRLVHHKTLNDPDCALRFELFSPTNIAVIKRLEDFNAAATDWEIFARKTRMDSPEAQNLRDMSDNELLTWTGALTRRLAHEFAVRRPSPKFDSLKYCLRVASKLCHL